MNTPRLSYVLEIVWGLVTLAVIGIAIHSTFRYGLSKSVGLYLIALISLLMYFMRRQRRLNNKVT
jgi:hypothetical protein